MGKKLAKDVHVDGTVYKAGAEVPDEIAALITNPKAWGEDETPAEKPAPRSSRSTAKK